MRLHTVRLHSRLRAKHISKEIERFKKRILVAPSIVYLYPLVTCIGDGVNLERPKASH